MLRSEIIRKQLLGVLTASALAAISACSAKPVDVTTLVADDGDPERGFVALEVNILDGRDDATRAALKHLKRNLPGAMMLGLINGETKILSADGFRKRFQSILEQKLGPKKGREIVESNIALLNEGAKLAASPGQTGRRQMDLHERAGGGARDNGSRVRAPVPADGLRH